VAKTNEFGNISLTSIPARVDENLQVGERFEVTGLCFGGGQAGVGEVRVRLKINIVN
jgi:hypothetical protein